MRAGLEDRTRKRNLFITEVVLIIYDTKFYVAIGRSAFNSASSCREVQQPEYYNYSAVWGMESRK